MRVRELTTIDDFRRVFALERQVWGYASLEDAVPVPILIVSQKIGGLIIGAFDDGGELAGFAYSMPGLREGRPFHWSHMLGVAEAHRNRGLGWQLKAEQRRRVLEMGLELVAWTFDPLQALNAHFNFVKLGALAREYHLDVYGESSSDLHRGTPTDRLIVEWWLRSPRVSARIEAAGSQTAASPGWPADAVRVNACSRAGEWLAPGSARLSLDAARVSVVVPAGFTEMQRRDLGLARAWREATREIFSTYLPRGYEVTDFRLEREQQRGVYLLSRHHADGAPDAATRR